MKFLLVAAVKRDVTVGAPSATDLARVGGSVAPEYTVEQRSRAGKVQGQKKARRTKRTLDRESSARVGSVFRPHIEQRSKDAGSGAIT